MRLYGGDGPLQGLGWKGLQPLHRHPYHFITALGRVRQGECAVCVKAALLLVTHLMGTLPACKHVCTLVCWALSYWRPAEA